ncbi:hypothetical protein [Hymenobacter cellulosilyticus]|uniref:Uncharacterized protein n=1 Tax=Hymenobacter cellulosilyticus TaxID=2932248 RepID=A0A8T9Q8G0_9BACT|nr:hypothetical protein [Hymenobacter cellulosilyticus]UOQ71809.1 hypothetical protein MUN79_24935 [Hymenobacter cellulosilyticus]
MLILFLLIPLTAILLLLWLVTQKNIFGKLMGLLWAIPLALAPVALLVRFLTDKQETERADIYGDYVIDRSKFAGKQADWQYNHYRFTITPHNELIFHETRGRTPSEPTASRFLFCPPTRFLAWFYPTDRPAIIS